jgi:type IV secretory pathway TrbD component
MRSSFDCKSINTPKTIGGFPWELIAAISFFFMMAAATERSLSVLIFPVVLIGVMRGAAKRDARFFDIYRRHRVQRRRYSPAYITIKNQSNPRPVGFTRLMNL